MHCLCKAQLGGCVRAIIKRTPALSATENDDLSACFSLSRKRRKGLLDLYI